MEPRCSGDTAVASTEWASPDFTLCGFHTLLKLSQMPLWLHLVPFALLTCSCSAFAKRPGPHLSGPGLHPALSHGTELGCALLPAPIWGPRTRAKAALLPFYLRNGTALHV